MSNLGDVPLHGGHSSSGALQKEADHIDPNEELHDDAVREEEALLRDLIAERRGKTSEEHVVDGEESARLLIGEGAERKAQTVSEAVRRGSLNRENSRRGG